MRVKCWTFQTVRGIVVSQCSEPVSYTHLDVYKRQLCEASTILNPTVLTILILGILALAVSAVGGLLGGWVVYWVHKKRGEDFNPTIGIAGVSCVPTTAKLAQHAAQDENPFAMILPCLLYTSCYRHNVHFCSGVLWPDG